MLAGIVIDSNRKPSSFAKIFVYRNSSVIDTLSPSNIAREEASIISDSTGYFKFDQLAPGIYTLKCVSSDTTSFAFRNNIMIKPESTITLDTITLTSPGIITGKVTRGGIVGSNSNPSRQDGFIDVYVNEINLHTVTNLSGNYVIPNVPAGTYSLVYYAADGFYVSVKDSITVFPGDTVQIPQFELKRIPWLPPPKPIDLVVSYNKISKTAKLAWSSYANANIIGFQIERRIDPLLVDTIMTTKNNYFTDTLSGFSAGTTIYYVVRSVNDYFVESYNEGPVSIKIE